MPQAAKETLAQLGRVIAQLDVQLAEIAKRLTARHKANTLSQRLAAIPGVGPLTAFTIALQESIRSSSNPVVTLRLGSV